MKSNKKAFTFVEMIGALFICSLLFIFLIPNMVRQYSNLNKIEKEESCSHYNDHVFTTTRGDYYISVDEKSARIADEHTGEKVSYS